MKEPRLLALMGVLTALGVATSHLLAIPVGVAKVFPVQHTLNVIGGVILGPGPAALVAFVVGLLRNMLGTGTPLAFPGGIFGALLAGALYRRFRRVPAAMVGELLGTGLLGAVAAWPVAVLVMGRSAAATTFIVPFAMSSAAGAIIGGTLTPLILRALGATGYRQEGKGSGAWSA